jgi:hypothetical protein
VFYPRANTWAPFILVAIVLFLYTVLHPDLRRTRDDGTQDDNVPAGAVDEPRQGESRPG